MIKKPAFKGARKECVECGNLWPWLDIDDKGKCPDCTRETQIITSKDVGKLEDIL